VGKHLLLAGQSGPDAGLAGGDQHWACRFSIRQRSGLRRQCTAAKEKLLGDASLQAVEIPCSAPARR